MSKTALVDTGFWIALFDSRDERHTEVGRKSSLLEKITLIVPWPVLYETLRTRFVRHPVWTAKFDDWLQKPGTVFLDDQKYCKPAYELAVRYSTRLDRPISMVDMLCRLLIEDPRIRIDYLFTTNPKDFHDLCRKHRVELA